MSSIAIRNLPHSRSLDGQARLAIRGGMAASGSGSGSFGPFANVNVNVNQNIAQLQNVEVNALNNVGVIGAGFVAPSFAVSPQQWANAAASFK